MERLFGDDVKNSCLALYYNGYMTGGRLLRWGLGVVQVIIYHFNAGPMSRLKESGTVFAQGNAGYLFENLSRED